MPWRLPYRRITGAHRRWQTIRATGLRSSARIALELVSLQILYRVYRFHHWHAYSPVSARPYRRVVADLAQADGDRLARVVEVGCGLGHILARVQAAERIGYDPDAGALRAGRLLYGRGVTFLSGSFESVDDPQIDVLIAVNWLHSFSPAQVEAWLRPLLSRTRRLLVDQIDPEAAGYKFHHDFAFLRGQAQEVRSARVADEPRRFVLYELHPGGPDGPALTQ